MKYILYSFLIAVLSGLVYFVPSVWVVQMDPPPSVTLVIFCLVFVVSFATMIILNRIKKNHEALMERLEELERQINNKNKTN